MDNKATGLTFDILRTALEQAKEGRAYILDKMLEVVPGPREETRTTAPKIQCITIPTENIRDVIGKGGETIRGIQDETGASIDIHEDGTVYVGGVGESVAAAIERIELIVKVPEVGEEYTGRVVSIQPFGAFVNLLPGKDGLLHISRVAQGRVEKVEDVLNVGDEVKVKVIEIDDRGKISWIASRSPRPRLVPAAVRARAAASVASAAIVRAVVPATPVPAVSTVPPVASAVTVPVVPATTAAVLRVVITRPSNR